MTFNVMCSFCAHNDEMGGLLERLPGIADTINRHDPDLVSLQELFTAREAKKLRQLLATEYEAIYAKAIVGFADPTLLVRKSRFRVLGKGGFWLGPNAPDFSFGWSIAYPRRVQWAELEDRATGRRFTFAGTHFDNNHKNKNPSVKLVVERFRSEMTPLILAGDLNLGPNSEGYATLTGSLRDTYGEVSVHPYVANGPTVNSDGCNLSKGSVFPSCRIDHVLLSQNAPWRTRGWSVDAYRYARGFVSDHRAVVVDLE